jgi:2-methylcitrate dehydratase
MQNTQGHKGFELHALADFVQLFSYSMLTPAKVERLKIHLLDSFACALGALHAEPISILRRNIELLGGNAHVRVPSVEFALPVDRAAQFYTALIRYLDFMDNFAARHGTCHPSDNIGSLLAISDWKDIDGKRFLEAMALAYNVQCRMIEADPSMNKGFDHTTQLAYSIAAGTSKLLRFNSSQTAHAIGISGSTFNPLVVVRAPQTSNWKGLISSHVALGTVNACLMAGEGLTGPPDVFEGTGGYNDDFSIKKPAEWKALRLDLYDKLILKKYNAEVHTQTAIDACLFLKNEYDLSALEIKDVKVEIFQTAYDITGGGEYGDRKHVHTKEEADHSLPYLLAVALIDGQVLPAQFRTARIQSPDVQQLLRKVEISTKLHVSKPKWLMEKLDPYTKVYPEKFKCSVTLSLRNGKKYSREQEGFHGFNTQPLSWNDVEKKFRLLAEHISPDQQQQIIEKVANLEHITVRELIAALVPGAESKK